MNLGTAALRGIVGPLFIGHGTQKLFGWFDGPGLDATAGGFEQMGLRPGRRHALAGGASEAVGGALLTLGALTPLAGSLITGAMVTAIRKVHAPNGPWVTKGGWEYNAVLIAAVGVAGRPRPGQPVGRREAVPEPARSAVGRARRRRRRGRLLPRHREAQRPGAGGRGRDGRGRDHVAQRRRAARDRDRPAPSGRAHRVPVARRGGGDQAEADRRVRRPGQHGRGARERRAHALARPAGSSPASAPSSTSTRWCSSGCLRVEHEGGDARRRRRPGRAGARRRVGPLLDARAGGAEYVAVCLPAFAPETVHRDDGEAFGPAVKRARAAADIRSEHVRPAAHLVPAGAASRTYELVFESPAAGAAAAAPARTCCALTPPAPSSSTTARCTRRCGFPSASCSSGSSIPAPRAPRAASRPQAPQRDRDRPARAGHRGLAVDEPRRLRPDHRSATEDAPNAALLFTKPLGEDRSPRLRARRRRGDRRALAARRRPPSTGLLFRVAEPSTAETAFRQLRHPAPADRPRGPADAAALAARPTAPADPTLRGTGDTRAALGRSARHGLSCGPCPAPPDEPHDPAALHRLPRHRQRDLQPRRRAATRSPARGATAAGASSRPTTPRRARRPTSARARDAHGCRSGDPASSSSDG